MSLPIHSPFTTPRPTTLAQAVAQARHPRNHATAQLEPHREELLRLSRAGESAESLVGGLRLMGIEIGRETMRRWLQQQLGKKLARRRRQSIRSVSESAPVTALLAAHVSVAPKHALTAMFIGASSSVPANSGDTAIKAGQGDEPNGSMANDVSMAPS